MEGRVVAITGGASGIGLATAKLLASRGAKVSIGDVCQQDKFDQATASVKETSSQQDDAVLTYHCDVRDLTQVSAWLKATVEKFGRLDHVANVAGVWKQMMLEEQDEETWDWIIGVNLTGAMHVLKESIKLMPDNAGCSIVVVTSVCGLHGMQTMAAYCASKHGLTGLVRTAAKELGPRGIRVNCVAPGAVDTPAHQVANGGPGPDLMINFAAQMPVARPAESVEIARVIAFLLGEESSFVTGSVYTVDGGDCC